VREPPFFTVALDEVVTFYVTGLPPDGTANFTADLLPEGAMLQSGGESVSATAQLLSIVGVPEPSTILLLATVAGIALLVCRSRRSKTELLYRRGTADTCEQSSQLHCSTRCTS
jgi:hypothetical protein